MITIHISPSEHSVSIEHVPGHETITLSPKDAYNLLTRLEERKHDLYTLATDQYDCKECGSVHKIGTSCVAIEKLPKLKERGIADSGEVFIEDDGNDDERQLWEAETDTSSQGG